MSDLFPKESVQVEPEPEKMANNEENPDDSLEEKNEGVKMDIEEEETEENKESPFVVENSEDLDIPKPKKKKRQISDKQREALKKAREVSRIKRMKLAEARNVEKEAKREATLKAREEKRRAKATKKAEELAEIEGYQEYKEKKYSFTKDELNAILDSTIDRHESKRRKRKEQDKLRQQPMVSQPYPYAMPHVIPTQAYHTIPTQAPHVQQPQQPTKVSKPKTWRDMTREEIIQARKDEEVAKANKFMNQFLNIK